MNQISQLAIASLLPGSATGRSLGPPADFAPDSEPAEAPSDFADALKSRSEPVPSVKAQEPPAPGNSGAIKRRESTKVPDCSVLVGSHFDPTSAAVAELASAGTVKPTTAAAAASIQRQESAVESEQPEPAPESDADRPQRALSPRSESSEPRAIQASATAQASRASQVARSAGPSTDPPAPAAPTPPTEAGQQPPKSESQADHSPVAAVSQPVINSAGQSAAASPTSPAAASAKPASASPSTITGVQKSAATLIENLARRADRAGTPPQSRLVLAEADEKIAGQIGRGFAAALRQGGGTVTIRLQPEALGDMKIKMALEGGRVEARFEVANEQARGLLNETIGSLRSALEARGLEVSGLNVTVGDPPDRPGQFAPEHSQTGDQPGGTGNQNQAGSGRGGSEHPTPQSSSPVRQAGMLPEIGSVADATVWPQDAASYFEAGGAPGLRVRLDALA